METIEEETETQNNSELTTCDSEIHPSSSENTTLQQKENRYGGAILNQLYVNKEHYKAHTSCTMSALTFTLKIYTN
jgi:surface antigen